MKSGAIASRVLSHRLSRRSKTRYQKQPQTQQQASIYEAPKTVLRSPTEVSVTVTEAIQASNW